MPILARLSNLWRNLRHKDRVEEELIEEVRSCLELLTEAKIREGLKPEEARRAARIEMGGVEQLKERVREVRMGRQIETLLQDLRYSLRMLRKNPAFTAIVVITLALGIGANTAVFSVINALLLRPYPFPNLDRIMLVRESRPADDVGQGRVAPADFFDLQSDHQAFDEVAAWRFRQVNLTGVGDPEQVNCGLISANLFNLLRVRPAQGRTFYADEDQPGREQEVILSHAFWQARLGGDPNLLGKTLQFNGRGYTVVGIMAEDFQYPLGVEIWTPLGLNAEERTERARQILHVLGRLKTGVSRSQGQAEVQQTASRLQREYPNTNTDRNMALLPLSQEQYQYTAPLFLTLQGAAGFVLLLASVNVANLLLARLIRRQKEVAVRLALGATRWRLLRLFASETMLLSLFGGLAAVVISMWGVPFIRTSMPVGISKYVAGWNDIQVDRRVLGFTVVLVVIAGVLFGVLTALRTPRVNLNTILKEGGKGSGGSGHHRLRSLLVMSEVVLAMVLLVGAGLMIKGFRHLVDIYQGFEPSGVLTFDIAVPQSKYPDDTKMAQFYEQTLQGLASLPGVQSVGVVSNIPASNVDSPRTFFTVEGRPALTEGDLPNADLQTTGADFFKTLRIPIRRGRAFSAQDGRDRARTVVISQSLAERFWPDEDAIGKRMKLGAAEANSPWLTVVGVVGDVKQNWFEPEVRPVIYLPYQQAPQRALTFVLRSSADPMSLVPDARSVVRGVDAEQPISSIQPLDIVISDAIAPIRIIGLLMIVFGGLALVLSLIGVYGVLGYYVADRRHEFGIRMALGAKPRDVLNLVFRQAFKLAAIGLALAQPVAYFVSRIMAGTLYGVVAVEGVIFLELTFLLLTAVLAASYIPARSATRVDPMIALRYE